MDGDLAYVCYVDRVISEKEIAAYLRDPARVAKAIGKDRQK